MRISPTTPLATPAIREMWGASPEPVSCGIISELVSAELTVPLLFVVTSVGNVVGLVGDIVMALVPFVVVALLLL